MFETLFRTPGCKMVFGQPKNLTIYPFGFGGSTTYFTDPPFVADEIYIDTMTITFEEVDPRSGIVTTNSVRTDCLADFSYGTGLINGILETKWQEVLTNFTLNPIPDLSEPESFVVFENGTAQMDGSKIEFVETFIQEFPPSVNQWWHDKNFRKYGVVLGGAPFALRTKEWINYTQQVTKLNNPESHVVINVDPLTKGFAIGYRRRWPVAMTITGVAAGQYPPVW